MTASKSQVLLLGIGLVLGACGGAMATRPVAPPVRDAEVMTVAKAPSSPRAAYVAAVTSTALSCGVYGLPGSPAVVALTSGADGRPLRAVLESDIFGGPDAEECLLNGVAGLPMERDSLRVVLPVYDPSDSPS